ncbi:MAG: response regulator, partial [Solirubrobacteraceae bacterium]
APAAAPPAPDAAPPAPPAVSPGAGLQRILWVDDHPENNAFEVEALQRKGVIIDQVSSNDDALTAVASGRPIDVVITDMGRDTEGPNAGLVLLAALRERDVRVPVIIYASAQAVARTRATAVEAGAYGVTSSATELMSLLAGLPAAG